MKKYLLIMVLLGMLFSCSQSDKLEFVEDSNSRVQSRGLFSNEVTIKWNEEGQTIDGFGVAQADCASDLFTHPQRDSIMHLLFSDEGLGISILRGEIFPHYWMNENDSTFGTDVNIDMPLSNSYFQNADANELKRTGQLWVSKKAKELYNVDKLFFSTWSPPAWMKQDGYLTDDNFASHGYLKPEYYQKFAEYLAEFSKSYNKAGLKVYAISPVNEPNYEADWNSCKWSEKQLADFIANYMGPTFISKGVDSKIIFGELAQWSTLVLGAFNIVSAKKYVENVMDANSDVVKYASIAAGHGYNIPNIPYEFPIVEYDKAVSNGLKVWLTEISSALDSYDGSMENGLNWAEVFYKYLTNAKVNAVCWWVGARYTETNESLIKLVGENYLIPKRFYTYGNYTKFIKAGSKRIGVEKTLGVSTNLLFSSFKNEDECVIVAVNKSNKNITTKLRFEGVDVVGDLVAYVTDENENWKRHEVVVNSDGTYDLTMSAKSVITYIGKTQ